MTDALKTPKTNIDGDPPMRFQERDAIILQTIHTYDGVLARRQLKSIFWRNHSERAMDRRLSKLYQQGYLDRPSLAQRRNHPIPEPIIWVGWKGALALAGTQGIAIDPPNLPNENQLRLLQRKLRERGFHWAREPRWSQLRHDLAVVDFRLAVEQSVGELPQIRLENWQNETIFRANPDVIEFSIGEAGTQRKRKKGVCPDAYFELTDIKREKAGTPHKARFLLELDNATHDNPSFGIEKVAAGAAYVRSIAFKDRFGANAGRWLVVTTGDVRLKNLMQQTREKAGAEVGLFFFTTLKEAKNANLFSAPIWQQANSKESQILLG